MALSLSYKNLYAGILEIEDASKVRIVIDKNVLSIPYELEENTKILGGIK